MSRILQRKWGIAKFNNHGMQSHKSDGEKRCTNLILIIERLKGGSSSERLHQKSDFRYIKPKKLCSWNYGSRANNYILSWQDRRLRGGWWALKKSDLIYW
jgi:hypothetical protein